MNIKGCDLSIIGKRYGKLIVLEFLGQFQRNETSKRKIPKFRCICDCGNHKDVFRTDLVTRKTTTCGSFDCWKKIKPKSTENLNGTKFGMLTVIRFLEFKDTKSKRVQILECLCDCGKTKNVRRDCLLSNITKSCGCQLNLYMTSIDYAVVSEYAKYKSGAKRRNICFCLTKQDVETLIFQKCYYCNSEPSRESCKSAIHLKNYTREKYLLNGIDRFDNNQGYILENCVPCCSHCNRAKLDYSYKEFLDWIKRVYEKQYQSG